MPDDDAFLAGLSFDVLRAVQERGAVDDVEFVPADDDRVRPAVRRASPALEVTRSEVAAARLRVVTDRGRGATTPAWIARLAATPYGAELTHERRTSSPSESRENTY